MKDAEEKVGAEAKVFLHQVKAGKALNMREQDKYFERIR